MESLGDKLRTAREEKGLGFDQVSRDTNISIRFLESLEKENFSDFPGEPYLVGFLKNYSNYLELDVQKMLSLYRAIKIQEQPIPVEQLLKVPPKVSKSFLIFLLILLAAGGAGFGVYKLIITYYQRLPAETVIARAPQEYLMESNSLERRFYKNDTILIPLDSNMYRLELINLGEAVTIRTPGGSVIMDLSQEVNIDLTNNGISDLRITVIDFAKNNADMGTLLQFFIINSIAMSEASRDVEEFTSDTPVSVSSTIIIPNTGGGLPSAYPFTLQINFQGYCMFRWEVLNERDRRDKNERYFQRSDELNIQAQNGIRIWVSNAQAAKFQVVGGGRSAAVDIGISGEVVVAEIRWVIGDDKQYRLALIRL
ncbi:MAG: helix-turn-helix domain-containing protein [Treponema sp.]|jgi:cytoskeletal protein RodZ|nr:helix-turn-helix domain-containing protein [Treponema sp.]